MARIALGIEYLGSKYHGWQHQEGLMTIQGRLENALSQIANHKLEVTAAGRTDAGVHALGQVVHFDTSSMRAEHAWIFGANSVLPRDIKVLWAKEIDLSFHARFSATARTYYYFIQNSRVRSAVMPDQLTWHNQSLNVDLMQKAANLWLGEHDFTSFRGSDCQAKSPVKNLISCKVSRHQSIVAIEIKANGFLHHMVRNMAGTLMEIGKAKKPVAWAKEVLAAKDRKAAAQMAAPNGLYLAKIDYPEQYSLPASLPGPLFFNIV